MFGKLKRKVESAVGDPMAIMVASVMAMGLTDDPEQARKRISPGAAGRGQVYASNAVRLIVGLLVAAILAANLLPTAIDQVNNVDTSSWDDSTAAIWGLMGILIVLGPVLYFVGIATDGL